ncbi:sortase domain-bontaining protein [Kitasatospora sp. SolWspMP-SS2h]|uniref:sortase domain-containing protein n=1 Tax=Kitasatospora sp. SolWspMP-SS2h TaxID=1305729 RepID=UPI00131405A9|nr:sortase [Kitasatospora sp. SolWspMP-SS2h]
MALPPACALAGSLALSFAATHQNTPPTAPAPSAAGTITPADAPPSQPAGPPPTPTALDIPDIGLHADLDPLTTDGNGVLQPPDRPDRAGWYTTAATWQSPLVLTGHVDYPHTGPAVFYHLGDLRPGQRVTLTTTDHHNRTYTVDAVRSYAKDDFPTQQVYGPTSTPQLRLITCGDWDDQAHAYRANTIAFATLTADGGDG